MGGHSSPTFSVTQGLKKPKPWPWAAASLTDGPEVRPMPTLTVTGSRISTHILNAHDSISPSG
jgi:hypothetical protein